VLLVSTSVTLRTGQQEAGPQRPASFSSILRQDVDAGPSATVSAGVTESFDQPVAGRSLRVHTPQVIRHLLCVLRDQRHAGVPKQALDAE
jgi:hypothetical protein